LLAALARDPAIGWQPARGTPYTNSIPPSRQPSFPGDLAIEERLASLMRWNALAMVVRELFEVNRHHIVLATLDAPARAGRIGRSLCVRAIQRYGIDTQADASWNC
jgi:pyruvate dehydrogenase complex dehydrogenase (E1) component